MDRASPRRGRNDGGQDVKWWHASRAKGGLHKVSRGTRCLNALPGIAGISAPVRLSAVPSTPHYAHLRLRLIDESPR